MCSVRADRKSRYYSLPSALVPPSHEAHCCSPWLFVMSDVYAKAMQEIEEVLADSEFAHPDDLGRLVYLTKVIKETMRLHPPGLGTSRVATGNINEGMSTSIN